MKSLNLILSILVLIALLSIFHCSKEPKMDPKGYWDQATSLLEKKKYEESINLYRKMVRYYPEDSLTVEALFVMAGIYKNNLREMDSALAIYNRICQKYPKSPKAPNAMFMIGYIYANEIKDYEKARESYNAFLNKYPHHILAQSAKWELKYLGKPLDEIPELQTFTKENRSKR
ncbi:MAG: tetratricopeptide repeat protein [Candidatus Marinimicrobia bacterium]|nr:tetratricopeptide repeat protein [Candidatus Neomarinimicrobiota bacterium]